MNYFIEAVSHMINKNISVMEVRRDVQTEFLDQMYRKMDGTVWATGCGAYYENKHGKVIIEFL